MLLLQIQNPILGPGTGTFTSHSIEIFIICLVMFLLGWFLHHVIHCLGHQRKIAELEANLKSARLHISDLEGDLESCNAAIINVKGKNASLSTKLTRLETETSTKAIASESEKSDIENDEMMLSSLATNIAGQGGAGFDAGQAKAVFGRKIKEDDLKIVEGIGPKTEGLLQNSSIHTWRQLGNTSVPQLQSILDKAGDRFQLLNPSTWPKQSRMAADGEWVKLREYQEFLIGGVEPEGDPHPDSEATQPQYLMGRKIEQDDLTIIEGIGPKIQALLKDNNINSWAALSETNTEQLQAVLDAAGEHFRIHDPATWSKQAEMAQAGKWDQLKDYQDFLDGGKEPLQG